MSAGQSPNYVKTACAGLWTSLPVFLAGSIVTCALASVVVIAAPGPNPTSVALAAILVAPPFAGLVAVACRITAGGDPGVRYWLETMLRGWWRVLALAAVPASAAACSIAAFGGYVHTGARWMLAPLALGGAVTVVALLGFVAAVPLLMTTRGVRLPWRRTWTLALFMVARRPVPFLGVWALIVVGVWAGTHVSASLLLLVPAPVACVSAAALFSAAGGLGMVRGPHNHCAATGIANDGAGD